MTPEQIADAKKRAEEAREHGVWRDTEAAAREHDEATRAQAFEEAAQDARQVASVTDRVGDIQYRNGALIVAKALDDRAAALREKARKP